MGGEGDAVVGPAPEVGVGLPDLSGVGFAELEAMPDSVLRAALERVLRCGGGPDRFAAFQNAV
ncbi:FxSxx-COOH cyclophane-containing RiPP peptide [Actinokineospora bangkokensis]|uniref:FXSXX-COOH protein n=1 Tax=Actinokineospora bangkokensis TaxID=1193682 RepID=A0A1Q9LP82_9PSEU|nr:FxSxx-COOH cyclophane-containing RiPP peptide [Actinokineospora bangkokensis]OLR93828.1 FXSXX-COOH protein [Actinokineospora bangkokensis]